MGLMQRWSRWASARPHVYLVEAPGGAYVRRAVEAALDERGWRRADAPAQADVLLAAGDVAAISGHLDLVWSQLPGPRVRRHVADAGHVDAALDEITRELRDPRLHAADAQARDDEVARWLEDDDGPEADEHHDHGEHEGHDHGGHGGHGGGGHGGHGGGMAPSGIPLAGGADDRDGLEMDQLVHTLGPALSLWPGGLVVRLTLAGDVIADVEHHWLGATPDAGGPIDHWDAVATTLAIAGDGRAARRARGVRDNGDAEGAVDHGGTDAARLRRHVTRLRRLRALPGDAADALLADPAAPGELVGIPDLLRGRDLADARLLLAAYAPRLRRDSSSHDQHDQHAGHAGHAGMSHD